MREQFALTFMIGYPVVNAAFEWKVCEAASQLCGGCTRLQGIGYWAEDGAEHKLVFTGEVQGEHSFILELSCEGHKVQKVYELMKQHITRLAKHYGVETNWVHVKKEQFTGMHFSVEQEA